MAGDLNRQTRQPLLGLQKPDRQQRPGSLEVRFGQDALPDPLDGGQSRHRRPVQPQTARAKAENESAGLSRNKSVGVDPMNRRPGPIQAAIQHRGPARGQNGLQDLAGVPLAGESGRQGKSDLDPGLMQVCPAVGVAEAAAAGGGSGWWIEDGTPGKGAVALDDLSQERPPVEIAGDREQDVAGNEPAAVKTTDLSAVDAMRTAGGTMPVVESAPSLQRQLE